MPKASRLPRIKTTLLGWRTDETKGLAETQRLITLLIRGNGFEYLAECKGCILMELPFRCQDPLGLSRRWIFLADNGGEINIGLINGTDNPPSIPTTWHSSNLNAETVQYRILAALNREPIDYDHRCEPIDLSVFES